MLESKPVESMGKNPYTFKEILYRVLALLFLVAAIGAVLLIAEDANATTEIRECANAVIRLHYCL